MHRVYDYEMWLWGNVSLMLELNGEIKKEYSMMKDSPSDIRILFLKVKIFNNLKEFKIKIFGTPE